MFRAGILQKPHAAALLLAIAFCLLYLVSLGARPLFIPDEVRYGEIAREILAHSDWIVPRLDGFLYFEKPPFGYWLNALSLAVFGANPFAVRFAGAFCAGLSALTTYFLGRHLFRSQFIAALAAFIFLTTFEVQAIGTFSVLDSTFAAMLNGGIALFAVGAMAQRPARFLYLAASGSLLGVAFLTKGFLALALPVLVLVPWLLIERRFDLLFRQSWIVVIVAAITIAPWSIAIHQQQPDFWRYFFWVEHIQRFAGENAQHEEPFYFYLMFFPIMAFPWIALLPASVLSLWKSRRMEECRGPLSLLALWAIVPFAFFSIASGKLATYVLPCFLPFALLVAAGLHWSTVDRRFVRGGIVVAGLFLCVALAALLHIQMAETMSVKFAADEQLKFAMLAGGFLLGIITLVASWATHDRTLQTIGSGLAMIPLLALLPWVIPNGVLASKAPVAFIQRVYAAVPPETTVVANGSLVRAVCWSLERDDVYLIDDPGELRYGVTDPEDRDRFLTSDAFGRMIRENRDVLLFCKGDCALDTLARLPVDTQTWSYGNFHAYSVNPARQKYPAK